MSGQTWRKPQVAEDDILDARAHVRLAERLTVDRLLAGQSQHHGDVVRAQ